MKLIVVTSPATDAGKTFVAVGLAEALAARGERVAFLDFDLAVGDSLRVFGLARDAREMHPTVSSWRNFPAPWEAALRSPAGVVVLPRPENPLDPFGEAELENLLAALEEAGFGFAVADLGADHRPPHWAAAVRRAGLGVLVLDCDDKALTRALSFLPSMPASPPGGWVLAANRRLKASPFSPKALAARLGRAEGVAAVLSLPHFPGAEGRRPRTLPPDAPCWGEILKHLALKGQPAPGGSSGAGGTPQGLSHREVRTAVRAEKDGDASWFSRLWPFGRRKAASQPSGERERLPRPVPFGRGSRRGITAPPPPPEVEPTPTPPSPPASETSSPPGAASKGQAAAARPGAARSDGKRMPGKTIQEKLVLMQGSLSLWFPQVAASRHPSESMVSSASTLAVVYSAARDVGKTTVSLFLALGLTRRGRRVCVIDADPTGRTITEHFAECGFPRNLNARSLPGWGFDYVPSPERPVDYTVELAREILSSVEHYDFVVVDCAPARLAVADYLVEYLRAAASVWLIVKPEAKAVADVTRFVRSEMQAAGVGKKVTLVVNRDYPLAPRRPNEVAREVGLPLGFVVPEDPSVDEMFSSRLPPVPKKRTPALDAVLSGAEAHFLEIFVKGGKKNDKTVFCR